MNNKKIFLRYGLLGLFLKDHLSRIHFKNEIWKAIIPALSLLLPSVCLLFLVTGKINLTPMSLIALVCLIYGLLIKKNTK